MRTIPAKLKLFFRRAQPLKHLQQILLFKHFFRLVSKLDQKQWTLEGFVQHLERSNNTKIMNNLIYSRENVIPRGYLRIQKTQILQNNARLLVGRTISEKIMQLRQGFLAHRLYSSYSQRITPLLHLWIIKCERIFSKRCGWKRGFE